MGLLIITTLIAGVLIVFYISKDKALIRARNEYYKGIGDGTTRVSNNEASQTYLWTALMCLFYSFFSYFLFSLTGYIFPTEPVLYETVELEKLESKSNNSGHYYVSAEFGSSPSKYVYMVAEEDGNKAETVSTKNTRIAKQNGTKPVLEKYKMKQSDSFYKFMYGDLMWNNKEENIFRIPEESVMYASGSYKQ